MSLHEGLRWNQLPAINPYIGFGWNYLGDTTLLQSPILPLNWLVLWFSPENVLVIRTVFFLWLLMLGGYLYLKEITGDSRLAIAGACILVSVPFLTSMAWMTVFFNFVCAIPLLLFLIDRAIAKPSATKYATFGLMVAMVGGDILSIMTLFPLAAIYSFASARGRFCLTWSKAWAAMLAVIATILLSTFFYVAPFLNNLLVNGHIAHEMVAAGFMSDHHGISLVEFWRFFKENGLKSLWKPIEGSGLLLYIPLALWIIAFFPLITRKRAMTLEEVPVATISALFLSAIGLILLPVILHGIPFISSKFPSFFRSQLNVIPFLVVLSSMVAMGIIRNRQASPRAFFVTLLIASVTLESMLFVVSAPVTSYLDVVHTLNAPELGSSLLFSPRVFQDMWIFVPVVNATLLVLLWWVGGKRFSYSSRKFTDLACVFVFASWAIFSVSLQSELRRQMHEWQLLVHDEQRLNNYLSRWNAWSQLADWSDPNFRTLPAGVDNAGTGRNAKLIADTELNVGRHQKVLFSYREVTHPYESLVYSAITQTIPMKKSHWFPPVSTTLPAALPLLRLAGIRWIVSADEVIDHPAFRLHGKHSTRHTISWIPDDSGEIYLYEIQPYGSVAFLADNVEVVEQRESWRRILDRSAFPWDEGVVYLEPDPARRWSMIGDTLIRSTLGAKILHETFDSVRMGVSPASVDRYLVLTYVHRPFWKAFVEGVETKVERAYGGFMAVRVPAGAQDVLFKYTPWDVYFGWAVTSFGLGGLMGIGAIRSRQRKRMQSN